MDPTVKPNKEWAREWNQDAKRLGIKMRVTDTGKELRLLPPLATESQEQNGK